MAATIASVIALSFASNARADSTADIINILIDKGILTEDEGNVLLDRRAGENKLIAQKETKQAIKEEAWLNNLPQAKPRTKPAEEHE